MGGSVPGSRATPLACAGLVFVSPVATEHIARTRAKRNARGCDAQGGEWVGGQEREREREYVCVCVFVASLVSPSVSRPRFQPKKKKQHKAHNDNNKQQQNKTIRYPAHSPRSSPHSLTHSPTAEAKKES
eukprot:TRINITY_DN21970_c0_g1_i1.p2 TRINITY_DN21970_c0_g1~~TRINITY_DN21970_c0_g1_i1.p2  ORF type:complete len:130 (-),score=8.24 TRINITY_DN21970_c0_g1_i1:177-566(-)